VPLSGDLRGLLVRMRCVARLATSVLAFAAAAALALLVAREGLAAGSCASRAPVTAARLPVPVVVTTDCGRYRFDRGGRVSFRRGFALPVPPRANYYMDLTWYRVDGGHLTIGHGMRTLWHSRGRFARYADMGVVASSRAAIAYSIFHGRRQSLFVALLCQPERLVAIGETPLGFTSEGGLVTERRATLLLRGGPGWQARRVVSGASDVVFDHAMRSVFFVAQDQLERFDGVRVRRLATLGSLHVGPRPQIEPLGRLVGLHSARRLVVLRLDGSVFASTPLPRPLMRVDRVSSALVADAEAGAVAFTATRGNTAGGSVGDELVYLLRSRATAARVIYRERLRFAVCERAADVSWHGRWLLYSSSEGRVALLDTVRPEQSIDLSATVARLSGMGGDEGRFDARWA
jgi:hypothetical protein